ncbi:DUF6128 domain-containing protein [Diplocloster agilis]|uniref:DUF6128 domain-containing protein n=1 Tax=Diplocloster agilis TaxID=2850323 RepID=A0A949JZU8_9FIRM|nr:MULTISPECIES: DUF6128 domain-containing protein [Lachnospiraceae]MBU9736737.1 hypothetical protein [Diplocloster agilis]MCU6736026.1 DUF6128 domain-containing protein [Suonthocola fibrivorans]SCJ85432.1 Uncharacterised protein [uncultured Clostridium sp.]
MSDYKRLVAYIYAYEKEQKGNNVGFAKIEARNGECRIGIHLRGIYTGTQTPLKAFAFIRRGSGIYGILLGEMRIVNGVGDFKTVTEAENLMDTGINLDDIGGLYIWSEGTKNYATEWDDRPIQPAQFYLYSELEKREASAQREDADILLKAAQADLPLEDEMDILATAEFEHSGELFSEEALLEEEQIQGQTGAEHSPEALQSEAETVYPDVYSDAYEMEEYEENIYAEEEQKYKTDTRVGDQEENCMDDRGGLADVQGALPANTEIDIAGQWYPPADDQDENIGPSAPWDQEDERLQWNAPEHAEHRFRMPDQMQDQTQDQMPDYIPESEADIPDRMPDDTISGREEPYIPFEQRGAREALGGLPDEAAAAYPNGGETRMDESRLKVNGTAPRFNTETLNPGAGIPSSGAGMPNAESGIPYAGVETPSPIADIQSPEAGMPSSNREIPSFEAGMPSAGMEKPSAGIEMPGPGAEIPSSGTNIPTATPERPAAAPMLTSAPSPSEASPDTTESASASYETPTADTEPPRPGCDISDRYIQPSQKWENLKSAFPVIVPFEDKETIECIRIEPKDLVQLPKEEWILGNNSFLLHGYYYYRYLLLGKMKKDGETFYVLGIPGIYDNREKMMAVMFGFPNFKPAKKIESKIGQFGFWYKRVRLTD